MWTNGGGEEETRRLGEEETRRLGDRKTGRKYLLPSFSFLNSINYFWFYRTLIKYLHKRKWEL